MKQKEYVALINRIQDLVYEVNSLTQYTSDTSFAQDKYGEALSKRKEELTSLMGELEEIMTVDSKAFNEAFMEYLNDDNYELTEVKLEGNTVHVAKPKDLKLEGGTSLLREEVYILSVGDSKILSNPSCKIGGGQLPVISIMNKAFKNIYFKEFSRHNMKYDKFTPFLEKVGDTTIKKYESKNKKR